MQEIALNYWKWFVAIANPYHDAINTISTFIIAIFTIVLARVAWKQTRDARILQRAYLDVKFDGIRTNPAGLLMGHVIFKNVGHLPAQKMCWQVTLETDGRNWRPPKIKNSELMGKGVVIPVGAEWPQVTNEIPPPQSEGEYLYVWGRATYRDGFRRWRKRRTDFCHSYPWALRETLTGGILIVSTKHARYHERGNSAT
jgi:hypothetical protein